VEKVLVEMTGTGFPAGKHPGDEARLRHAGHHGLQIRDA
jgi:hypothetical protein